MSTRGLIGKATGDEGKFSARYHHSDSYPTGLGQYLVQLYRGHFNSNLEVMLKVLLEEHPAGWSSVVGSDFRLKPGYVNSKYPSLNLPEPERKRALAAYYASADYRRPHCYCHGQRHEEPQEFSEADDSGAEWAYVFDTTTGENVLHVLDRALTTGSQRWHWEEVGRVELDSLDPIDWSVIECGENFERCRHYAWHHNLLPRTSNLSTRTYLGLQPLEFHDAVAFVVNGKRYLATGCGGRGDYLNRARGGRYTKDAWVATVKASNGRRLDFPVAICKGNDYSPYPGVAWVYPATKENPRETLVSLEQGQLFQEVRDAAK